MTNMQDADESLEMARSENGDSTSSELERLNNASPCPSGTDSPTERGIAKTKKQEDVILRSIEEAARLGTNTLDLSHKKMRQIPSEIMEMPQIEYLYLEGNELTTIPDELFDKLPNLKWLDLRRNYLVRLPSVYTGHHQNLRNLLVESNNLRTLPLELGLIKSLHGLNISNNPLDFPPQSIIEKGTNEILKFLREMIEAKSSGKLLNGKKARKAVLRQHSDPMGGPSRLPALNLLQQQSKSAGMPQRLRTGLRRSAHASIKAHSARLASQQFPIEEEPNENIPENLVSCEENDLGDSLDGSSSSDDDWDEDGDLKQYAYRQAQERTLSTEAAKRAASGQIVPLNKTVQLHRPVSYTSIKQTKEEKIKKAGAMGTFSKSRKNSSALSKSLVTAKQKLGPQSATSVLDWKVNPYPEPPPPDYINQKSKEERLQAKAKEFKEKTDAILQRRKDEEMLKDWRNETKRLQQKKYFDSLRKGTKDFLDPVQAAPFDIDQDYVKIPTNEERIKHEVKMAHEKIRRQVSPASRQRIEEEKAQRILQLEKRIKAHTTQMHERRKQPKGSPQEEMEAARRELEVVKMLQKDLLRRYTELKQWTTGRSLRAGYAGPKQGSSHIIQHR
ncbi:leucine-rich repeat-containing protein 27-like isoform X3 [Mercenaria mercenaria]|uniref:leucine-rich repeat-containing protein 27-like isoform X3 n=2 Tax=Mercenaria mercenaria TaxID=6596 RepID=UPI00234F26C4|nr:leucine-rich repeat-containing protein 27-like isoform X3 [Mercenaria mercenaria]